MWPPHWRLLQYEYYCWTYQPADMLKIIMQEHPPTSRPLPEKLQYLWKVSRMRCIVQEEEKGGGKAACSNASPCPMNQRCTPEQGESGTLNNDKASRSGRDKSGVLQSWSHQSFKRHFRMWPESKSMLHGWQWVKDYGSGLKSNYHPPNTGRVLQCSLWLQHRSVAKFMVTTGLRGLPC